eukprot:3924356-Ditylum_brightwellii.AAC.1
MAPTGSIPYFNSASNTGTPVDATNANDLLGSHGVMSAEGIELDQDQEEPMGEPVHHIADHADAWFPLLLQ